MEGRGIIALMHRAVMVTKYNVLVSDKCVLFYFFHRNKDRKRRRAKERATFHSTHHPSPAPPLHGFRSQQPRPEHR